MSRGNRTPAIEKFLQVGRFAVVGASTDRSKYGNKVLRCYQQHALPVTPVNPKADQVEGINTVANLRTLPAATAVSIVAPPAAAAQIVADAKAAGIQNLWFQPGAEEAQAIATATAAGMNVIHGGPCVLVILGYKD